MANTKATEGFESGKSHVRNPENHVGADDVRSFEADFSSLSIFGAIMNMFKKPEQAASTGYEPDDYTHDPENEPSSPGPGFPG